MWERLYPCPSPNFGEDKVSDEQPLSYSSDPRLTVPIRSFRSTAMRLLFLPYKPASDESLDAFQERPKISHQKHAAREHHRKAKLVKQQLKSNKRGASGGGQGAAEHGGRFIEWKVENSELEGNHPNASPTSFLGAGRLDPFDVYCARKQPLMVHEMLDHGKDFVGAFYEV